MKLFSFLLIALITAADQLTKWMILNRFSFEGESLDLSSFFSLTLVYNPGISFGMLALPQPWGAWILTGMTTLIILGLIIWMLGLKARSMLLGLALVVGGAIGNVIDRIRFGHVVDFLNVHYDRFYWPAFNLADSMICVGVAILIWSQLRNNCRSQ